MNWPWRMPQYLPWATPYPLPRDTSEALLGEGHCENFGLLLERYLAYGDNRGQLQLLRELTDRKALVPDFAGQKELIEAHHARWQATAEELGAITFTARPDWRAIVGLGTNAILGGGMSLHPIFGFPIIPATALKGVTRAYARWVLERPEEELDRLLGKVDDQGALRGDLLILEGIPATSPVIERDVINPIFGGRTIRDVRQDAPPANYLAPSPIFFLALGAAQASIGWAWQASAGTTREAAEQGARAGSKGRSPNWASAPRPGPGSGYWLLD